MFCVKQKVGKHVYLFEATSYRDDNKQSRQKRTPIGKLDPVTGDPIYKKEYLERLAALGKEPPIPVSEKPTSFSTQDIQDSTVKEFGAFHLYKNIGVEIGLLDILQSIFPKRWQHIFNLVCYFVSTGDPLMYFEDWLNKTEGFPADMNSPEISRLLHGITHKEREEFFRRWGEYRCEREYLALDITSYSSYSQLIDDVEWGYNRDGDKLPQVNHCLLLGEQSHLPVFQTMYSGSLNDVSTLTTTLSLAFNLGQECLKLVMDRGFFSLKNVNAMLGAGSLRTHFIISVPFNTRFAKEQIIHFRDRIDSIKNTITIGKEVVRGITVKREWGEHIVYTHIYFNPTKYANAKNTLYGYVAALREKAEVNPEDAEFADEFKNYLLITKKKSGYQVDVRNEVVAAELSNVGWMILISDHATDAKEVLRVYRAKDVVEKGFWRFKHYLDMKRLRVHSDSTMHSKTFIVFLALILMSRIHNVMLDADLYKKYTLRGLIKELEKLRVQYIGKNRILFPLTAQQKKILKNFGIKPESL